MSGKGELLQWEALNYFKERKKESTPEEFEGDHTMCGFSEWERKKRVETAITGLREGLHTKLGTKKPIFSSTPNPDTH